MRNRIENIVGKGESPCYKKFSFSHNVFHSYICSVRQNVALCGNGLNNITSSIDFSSNDNLLYSESIWRPQNR